MPYVIQEACLNCKYGDCVEVCPVNCFFEGETMLYIHPDECIDCDACRSQCPVDAIVPGDEAEEKWIQVAKTFEYSEDKRRDRKDQVKHGPHWDASRA